MLQPIDPLWKFLGEHAREEGPLVCVFVVDSLFMLSKPPYHNFDI